MDAVELLVPEVGTKGCLRGLWGNPVPRCIADGQGALPHLLSKRGSSRSRQGRS